MIKMILKSALISSLLVFNLCAQAGQNKEELAGRCSDLGQTVNSLISSQRDPICIDKLYGAAIQMSSAALLILDESSEVAKFLIDNAASSLQYAQLNGCNRYIQISHSRLEAHKLRQLL